MLNSIKNIAKQYEQKIVYDFAQSTTLGSAFTVNIDLLANKTIHSIQVIVGGEVVSQYGSIRVAVSGGSSYTDNIISVSGQSGNAFNGTVYSLTDNNDYVNCRYIRVALTGQNGNLTTCTVAVIINYE